MPEGEPVVVQLDGHLSETVLRSALAGASVALVEASAGANLLVDCRDMTGYDAAARQLFVEWNSRYKSKVKSVAVVTERRLWHVVVSAMALASGQRMKAFDSRVEALGWLEEGKPPPSTGRRRS